MKERILRVVAWIRKRAGQVWTWLQRFRPGPRALRWSARGVFATTVVLAGYFGVTGLRTGWGWVVDALIGMLLTAGVFVIALLLGRLVLFLLAKVPRKFIAPYIGAWFALGFTLQIPGDLARNVAIGTILTAAFIWGGIAVVSTPGFRQARTSKRLGVLLLVFASLVVQVAFVDWVRAPGSAEDLLEVDLAGTPAPSAMLEAPDPFAKGTFEVATLIYGWGGDRRPEFGAGADLITEPVDGKPFVNKLSGWKGKLRNGYWGFDRRALPLNGRVWYPVGEGPFPLVLCVHGNHSMREYSDPGYAWLGEVLASRGFIFVSVDENFLNGDWTTNYNRENDARGWMLLEHLRQWRTWSGEADNPFTGRVDMDRIVLVGHSRGGEAVAVAAAFNRLTHYPDDATVTFDYGFAIRGIVGIAPVDGQYNPAGQSTPLRDLDYLLLQGSHDGDVSSFSSDRQYKRLAFSGGAYHFKTSAYIYRANHGQFNTVWGDHDWGEPGGYVLNVAELLPGDQQRQAGGVYIGAFLETVLHEDDRYLPFFQDYRRGREWLPETYYINRFDDAGSRFAADYSEDVDVTTATLQGATLGEAGLVTWKETDLGYRGGRGDRQNQVVQLGWLTEEPDSTAVEEEAVPYYALRFPEERDARWRPQAGDYLVFALSESTAKPSKPDTSSTDTPKKKEKKAEEEKVEEEKAEEQEEQQGQQPDPGGEEDEGTEKKEKEPRKPLDLTIVVTDSRGERAAIALSEIMPLMPPLTATFTRLKSTEGRYGGASQPVLQSYRVPFRLLLERNPRLRPDRIAEIRFVFDRSRKGMVLLDEIGFDSGG